MLLKFFLGSGDSCLGALESSTELKKLELISLSVLYLQAGMLWMMGNMIFPYVCLLVREHRALSHEWGLSQDI